MFLIIIGTITLVSDMYFLFNFRKFPRSNPSIQLEATASTKKAEDYSLLHNRSVVANRLREAGATVLDESKLPTLAQIGELYGPGPIILGLEHCERFRNAVPAAGKCRTFVKDRNRNDATLKSI